MGFGKFLKGQVDSKVKSIDLKIEDRFYEQALTEIENDNKNKASWAKALQLTEGNGLDNIPKPADRKRLAAKYAAALLMAGE